MSKDIRKTQMIDVKTPIADLQAILMELNEVYHQMSMDQVIWPPCPTCNGSLRFDSDFPALVCNNCGTAFYRKGDVGEEKNELRGRPTRGKVEFGNPVLGQKQKRTRAAAAVSRIRAMRKKEAQELEKLLRETSSSSNSSPVHLNL